MTDRPGELTFPINRRVDRVETVSDAEVAEAVRYAFQTLKLVVEPGGAVSLAAVLAGKVEARDRTTALHPVRRQCRPRPVRRHHRKPFHPHRLRSLTP